MKKGKGSERFSKEDTKMANIHKKRCSTSLAIKKMKIKTTLRRYCTPTRMAIIKSRFKTNVDEKVEKREALWAATGV